MADAVIDLASLDTGAETNANETQADSQQEQQSTGEIQPGNQDGQQGATETAETLSGKAIRDAVRALSQQSPEHSKVLKQLADTHFRVETAYKQAFPTPQEALSAKQLIEGIGGVEGASQLTQRIAAYDQQDAGLKTGDPGVLEALFKDFPEGAAALAPHYLDKLSATNPQAFAATIAPHAVQMLVNANVGGHLDAILNETDPARAKALVGQLNDWFKVQSQNIQQQLQNGNRASGDDPNKARAAELDQREQQIFSDAVSVKVNSAVGPVLTAAVEKYAKQYKLNDTQKAHYQESLQNAVINEMNADKTYQQQVDLRKANKARTHDTVASYISGEFNRRINDRAFDVAKGIYGAPRSGAVADAGTGVVKAGSAKTGPNGGPLMISARPSDAQLDLNRPDADILMIKGQGYLKDGRFVTWRKQTA